MSTIICIIGNKGGTGKTTLSHMLCQGFGLLGQRSACVLTDVSREPLSPDGRRYVTADGRSPEALHKVVGKLRTMQDWIGVIDGGGNRSEVDRLLDSYADIVLLPFRDSHEDMRTVRRDLETFPRAYGLPSQWATNAWQRDAADRAVLELLGDHRDRLLHPVASLSASKLLLQKHIPASLPSNLGNACRALARQVMDVLETDADALGTDAHEAAHSLPAPTVLPAGYASTAHH
ncbi:MAG TPA: hypothetical protein PLN96_13110 [Zoogloea sp.]|uniref:hypothetical protein n=1 Tax=Zoogloea sp. TaxID=49181 RepID=UPI002C5C5266|nr:hypothetical protein [Zoogloea sp.]HMV18597.1 hypothetical protein [Rhodocyclaceae bacterium]HMV63990.1 hypothetical protein [Rhodocyclaceae bacterium]HMW53280.1 hypothetical protein [Rhodocyclaceae bacterium]HMY50572.1 hypothetical protein [Rhodocyclaceae bacterium]HMZ74857.1 hypothetical protein [Rhodocyclaceae bacterium]